MRWSKLKQLVEDRMADSLQRRVEVHSRGIVAWATKVWSYMDHA